MKIAVLAVCVALSLTQQPAGPPPTEVFLAPLTVEGGSLKVGSPRNISNSPGYDNQPSFTPDGRALLFTSARGEVTSKCGNPQTDVYRFELQAGTLTRVTETGDCEYSPTVTPDGRHISVIQVEPDGTQRLWRFTSDGKDPVVVLKEVKPVGYHAWLDDQTLALFVLGQPATLQVARTTTGTAETVASNIGQSIQKMPDGGVSFVQQAGEATARTLTVTQLKMENGKAALKPLTPVVQGATQAHVAWAPDGTLLMAHADRLYAWRAGTAGWRPVADLAALGLRNVTRLAVSPKADLIAIVGTAGQ